MNAYPPPRQNLSLIKRFISEQKTMRHAASIPPLPLKPPSLPVTSNMSPTRIQAKPTFVPFQAPLVNDRAAASLLTPVPALPPQLNDQPEEQKEQKEVRANPQTRQRAVAIILILALALCIYLIWRPPAPTESVAVTTSSSSTKEEISQTDSRSDNPSATAQSTTGNTIHVYVVGAVHKPGVYELPSNARVYQLLQAAGGPLPGANLVALNLAAKLQDGQEVYVTKVGEKPPTYVGGIPSPADDSINHEELVNINEASSEEIRERLHVSSQTAESIIDYREVHGQFTDVEQLLDVVSETIYKKIKALVTV